MIVDIILILSAIFMKNQGECGKYILVHIDIYFNK